MTRRTFRKTTRRSRRKERNAPQLTLYRRPSAEAFNEFLFNNAKDNLDDAVLDPERMDDDLACMKEGFPPEFAMMLMMWLTSALNMDPELDSVFIIGPALTMIASDPRQLGEAQQRFLKGMETLVENAKGTTSMICHATSFERLGSMLGHAMSIIVRFEPDTKKLLFRLVDTSDIPRHHWPLLGAIQMAWDIYSGEYECELDMGLKKNIQVTGSCTMASMIYSILGLYPGFYIKKKAVHENYDQLELFLNDYKARVLPCIQKTLGGGGSTIDLVNTIADCDDPSAFLELLKTIKRWNEKNIPWRSFIKHDKVYQEMRRETNKLMKAHNFQGPLDSARDRNLKRTPQKVDEYSDDEDYLVKVKQSYRAPLHWAAQVRNKTKARSLMDP
jgi:hypothetical protein